MELKIKKSTLKKAVLWGIIAVLLIAVIYVTFNGNPGTASNSLGSTSQAAKYASAGMVGSC